jgi:hypothetical protein
MTKCHACAYSYLEPDAPKLVCGHSDTGNMFGAYTDCASSERGHCGPNHSKFQQHPGRNEDGTLKVTRGA